MKSLASLALMLAAPALAQEPPPGDGPRGTSGEARLDLVGRASVDPADGTSLTGVRVASEGFAAGDVVEATALDSGKVALALAEPAGGRHFALSPALAADLGVRDGAGVRLRRVAASPQDVAALRAGRPASGRLSAPDTLLAALRRRVPPPGPAPVAKPGPAPVAKPRPAPAASVAGPKPAPAAPRARAASPVAARAVPATRGSFVVQVGVFSTADRAAAVAKRVGGNVSPAGRLYRVRIGPLPDRAAADRARAKSGIADATILRLD